ncbi:MAG: 16S rRNA (cytosine(1402)-N(4))-methyltransferase RsmH [Lentisphaeria bacterium]|nr:16S rRNA (cytosine(1402)-N(4))-methyltransferase RsmH [Lentisphaeria bacterium]
METGKDKKDFSHIPVLAQEVLSLACTAAEELKQDTFKVIDGTLGCGGHSSMILEKIPRAVLLGIDRDPDALKRSEKKLAFAAERCTLAEGEYADMKQLTEEKEYGKADFILLDIGVSSPQIDDPERGFSFRFNGPLDMRMDRKSPKTAATVLNTYPEQDLCRIFREYGELKEASLLAKKICEKRIVQKFSTTKDFAEVCESVLKRNVRKGSLPSPTLCFQALRIEVNDELGQLRKGLEAAVDCLNPGGTLAVISFHSLEDRIVKNFFQDMAVKCKCPPTFPVCVCNWKPLLEIRTKKPLTAGDEELMKNQRAACAKLRAAVRTGFQKTLIQQ